MKTNIEQLRKADWDALETEVVAKIRLLRGLAEHLEPTPLHDRLAAELILPCLELLGQFCLSVTEEGEEGA